MSECPKTITHVRWMIPAADTSVPENIKQGKSGLSSLMQRAIHTFTQPVIRQTYKAEKAKCRAGARQHLQKRLPFKQRS